MAIPKIFEISTPEENQLFKAIVDKDVDKICVFLESGEYALNENYAYRGDPIVIRCVWYRYCYNDREDETKRCAILKLLVQHGADVNSCNQNVRYQNITAAMYAAHRGYLRSLKLLKESNADLSVVSVHGYTALMLAAKGGQAGCVKYLIEQLPHSALELRDRYERTALMVAASYKEKGSCLCVQHFIDAGAVLDEEDEDGETALMLALACCSFQVVHVLLQKGACVNTTSHSGETPLKMAIRSQMLEIATSLLEKGALVNTVSHSGETPLTVASIDDSIKLLRYGLDPTLSRRDRDCLNVKIKQGQKALVRALILNGFPPIKLDLQKVQAEHRHLHELTDLHKPRSPLTLAIVSSSPDIAKYLVLNNFFTYYDIFQLSWDKEIIELLETRIHSGSEYSSSRAQESREVLGYLSSSVPSLVLLCLTTISSVLSEDLCNDIPLAVKGIDRWMCKPTFKEKVNVLKIPPSLKRALLHQTPSSAICCQSWDTITLGDEGNFPECKCNICEAIISPYYF